MSHQEIEMLHLKIKNQQEKILEQIDKRGEKSELVQSELLQKLNDYDQDVIKKALGDFGVRLSGFASEVDITHPDLSKIYDGAFSDEEFESDLLNLLDIASNPLSPFVSDNLRRVIIRHPRVKQLSVIDAPSKNLLHARFTNDKIREKIRNQKTHTKY